MMSAVLDAAAMPGGGGRRGLMVNFGLIYIITTFTGRKLIIYLLDTLII